MQQMIGGQCHVRRWWADLGDWRNLVTFFFFNFWLTFINISIFDCRCVRFFGNCGRSAGRFLLSLHPLVGNVSDSF